MASAAADTAAKRRGRPRHAAGAIKPDGLRGTLWNGREGFPSHSFLERRLRVGAGLLGDREVLRLEAGPGLAQRGLQALFLAGVRGIRDRAVAEILAGVELLAVVALALGADQAIDRVMQVRQRRLEILRLSGVARMLG